MAVFDTSNINLYLSLFHGREDIYARRWEKDGKSGYMPAYDVDWNEYNKHKAQGGLFRDFKGKKPQPFSKNAVIEHLNGKATIGIYALLPDNSSCATGFIYCCGEGGIRTPGTSYPVRQFSKLLVSATHPPLRIIRLN